MARGAVPGRAKLRYTRPREIPIDRFPCWGPPLIPRLFHVLYVPWVGGEGSATLVHSDGHRPASRGEVEVDVTTRRPDRAQQTRTRRDKDSRGVQVHGKHHAFVNISTKATDSVRFGDGGRRGSCVKGAGERERRLAGSMDVNGR